MKHISLIFLFASIIGLIFLSGGMAQQQQTQEPGQSGQQQTSAPGQPGLIPDSVRAKAGSDYCIKMGKLVFVDAKCTTCHTVESANLTEKKGSSKAPDLSGIGSKFPAEDIMQFLTKDKELDGKKHAIAFKGEKQDLMALSLWLESLKTP